MRVVCIDDSRQHNYGPSIEKGKIYTVIKIKKVGKEIRKNGFRYPPGCYYQLVELGNTFSFHESAFIEINEDQKDETEMEREYSLSPYERFQMSRYGNILPTAGHTPESDLFESGIEELNRLAEWTESMAEMNLEK